MDNIKVLVINREKITTLSIFLILIGLASIVPLLHQQMIVGPIVNATLFISTLLLGAEAGIVVGLIPSVIALSAGLLPAMLAPMIPFIMIGNTILILTFDALKNKNYWLGVIISSILKFFFLYSTSSMVVNLLLKKDIAYQVAMMMSWPQLLTAIAGGILAFLFIRIYK
jgi:hypothetical protein